ncbi:hypothetical protein X738_32065 [Mesorhizobium sp. LNHC209A00]|nr:hypothetical protein X738_32065 [Mesorhizobium sp. LNHC209A00]
MPFFLVGLATERILIFCKDNAGTDLQEPMTADACRKPLLHLKTLAHKIAAVRGPLLFRLILTNLRQRKETLRQVRYLVLIRNGRDRRLT